MPENWNEARRAGGRGLFQRVWCSGAAALIMVILIAACGSGDAQSTTTTLEVVETAAPTTTSEAVATTTTSASTTTTEESSGTTPTTDRIEATGPTITSGGVSITLPSGWVGADVAGGPEGVGTVMFPDDPEKGEAAENAVGLLPRAVILFAIDASRLDQLFVDNLNVLVDPSVPPEMNFAEMVEAQAQGIEGVGGSVLVTEIIPLGEREVGRVLSELSGYSIASYFIVEDGTTYVITYTFDSLTEANLMAANGSVATFSVG